uniref:BCL2 like 12 n=1 Tax=Oryzias melastigma TaxID=30732 RepID=A0A3B3DK18_ORYME
MSESPERRSSVSSVSLLEIKAETHLILQAFLDRTLAIPQNDWPGRVGGAYDDHNKFSMKLKPKPKAEPESLVENEEEKKSVLNNLLPKLPLLGSSRHAAKDSKGSLDREISPAEVFSSTSSDEGDSEKKRKDKRKRIQKRLSSFFKKKEKPRKEKNKEGEDSHPPRPQTLPISRRPKIKQDDAAVSPSHPPDFYTNVAGKLEKIAQTSIKRRPASPEAMPRAAAGDKEKLIQDLAQVLSSEGDSINEKIQANPFLRSSLNRLSYASFAKLLDNYSNAQVTQVSDLPPSASPTLRRIAVSMEVSRRIVTATGAQRTQGYAERYMETFVPWVKQHGGWVRVSMVNEFC